MCTDNVTEFAENINTGLSKRNGAKFSGLSLNFPKLADWLCMGWPSCLAALGREFSNRGTFILHDPVERDWARERVIKIESSPACGGRREQNQ